ncbi:MAG: hypothetical protein R3B45_07610 [Bdellovibrionota bacterium]
MAEAQSKTLNTTTSEEEIAQFLRGLDEKNLALQAQTVVDEYHQLLRDLILGKHRVDLLATEILGYDIRDFHQDIIETQNRCVIGKAMILAFRGCGKSTVATVVRCIYEIIKNPNIRILIASKTQLQAEIFLREIKDHFVTNEKLRNIFGDHEGSKWDTKEIIVSKRTKTIKESTVSCIGVGGPTASRHYDLIICDDIVDEENARTELQRERLKVWFYKSLLPTLEPNGRVFIVGTRWHPDDLYSYVLKNSPEIKPCVVKAIGQDGTTPWPERFSMDRIIQIREELGVPIFETQYQMNTQAMEGRIFSYEMFHWYERPPDELLSFQGVDLAISQKSDGDYFAHCTIGLDPLGKRYVLDIFRTRASFAKQTDVIVKRFFRFEPLRVGIEANAYQAAQANTVGELIGRRKVVPIFTLKDKVTRAMKLAAKVESAELLFRKDQMHLVEEMLRMPDGEHDDMFDALEIAVNTSQQGMRKKRAVEFGVI